MQHILDRIASQLGDHFAVSKDLEVSGFHSSPLYCSDPFTLEKYSGHCTAPGLSIQSNGMEVPED